MEVMKRMIEEMSLLVARHASRPIDPRLPLRVSQSVAPGAPTHGLYHPMLCFVLEGEKRLIFGNRLVEYRAGDFLVASVDLPVIAQVIAASEERPYRVVTMRLNSAVIAELISEVPKACADEDDAGISISPMTPQLVDPLLRMMRLLEAPNDIAVMVPMLEREILYRALQGPLGSILRQIVRSDSRPSQIRKTIEWIRLNYAEPVRIDDLARLAGMSVSSFHRHFKSVVAMSPLAYQKQIRLQEARRQLIATPVDAAKVAHLVGYESASQFNREYARLFGRPPKKDAEWLTVATQSV